MADQSKLVSMLQEFRGLLARPDNDFSWSSWENSETALREIDAFISVAKSGAVPDLGILLVPTGPAQEVSLSSGWADEFLTLADRIEAEVERA
ncbi:hypothetical protein GCM10009105_16660 [Dokdonella soli]|uniref:Uncharacterized protein n=1 Tax=Dokdonella soli TaxID=529810 RepID=A0ABN1IH23_9GAMM